MIDTLIIYLILRAVRNWGTEFRLEKRSTPCIGQLLDVVKIRSK